MDVKLNQVLHGDCLKLFAKVPDESVELVFADPPFNIGYDYDVYKDDQDENHYLDWTRRWTKEAARVLSPTGGFWLAIGDEYAADCKVIAQREHGLICRNWIVWYYTFGVHCKRKFARSHAHLFHFVKDAKQHTFNDDAVRVPSARMTTYADSRAVAKGRLPDDTWILRPQDIPDSFQGDEDTWYFPRVAGTFKERRGFHGCQMPEQLLGRIIKVSSNPDHTVLDPFAGSGTTLAVAKKLGRKYLGFELSDNYVAEIKRRLANLQVGDPLAGAAEPSVSAPSTAEGRHLHRRKAKSTDDRGLFD